MRKVRLTEVKYLGQLIEEEAQAEFSFIIESLPLRMAFKQAGPLWWCFILTFRVFRKSGFLGFWMALINYDCP